MVEQDVDRAAVYHADAAASAEDGVDKAGEEADDSDDKQHGQGKESRKRGHWQ